MLIVDIEPKKNETTFMGDRDYCVVYASSYVYLSPYLAKSSLN